MPSETFLEFYKEILTESCQDAVWSLAFCNGVLPGTHTQILEPSLESRDLPTTLGAPALHPCGETRKLRRRLKCSLRLSS